MTRSKAPPGTPTALSATQRKAAQRQRARADLLAPGANLGAVPLTALAEALPWLMAEASRERALASTLIELGKRAGLTVCVTWAQRRRSGQEM